ncbi:FtsX-like permease family protein [Streptomyces noboritoensis]|uniref:FtsX-like permease family protein n=1 Tax=Streptomyces noboritoensis TaxID=67337 RepID=A0ABV6TWP9_9ACTN
MERGSGASRRTVLAGLALGVPLALSGCGPKGHASTSASVSGADTTIMIIRHGEKPGGGERGRDESGQRDKKSLTARGWQRAKALPGLFVAASGRAAPPARHALRGGGHGAARRCAPDAPDRRAPGRGAARARGRLDRGGSGERAGRRRAGGPGAGPDLLGALQIPHIVRALVRGLRGEGGAERFGLVWVFTGGPATGRAARHRTGVVLGWGRLSPLRTSRVGVRPLDRHRHRGAARPADRRQPARGSRDTVTIGLPGSAPAHVTVAGIVDLPQADSLFQKVGAPPPSQPAAPPDNVILLPQALFARLTAPVAAVDPAAVTTQIHIARDAPLPADPAAAYTAVTSAARNLEARTSGAVVVGDNLGAALDAARKDALYAQVLFLFLGVPGAVLAALLTAAVAGAGADRRRREQALLRTRGLRPRQVAALAGAEAAVVGVGGGLLGVGIAALAGRAAFKSASFGASTASTLAWSGVALLLGLTVAGTAVLLPTVRDLRLGTVTAARREVGRARSPRWMRFGVDFALLAVSLLVLRAASGNQYALVLAPRECRASRCPTGRSWGPACSGSAPPCCCGASPTWPWPTADGF